MAKMSEKKWEGSAKDLSQDKKLAKKRGESLADWEKSSEDTKHDKQQSMKGLKMGGVAKKAMGGMAPRVPNTERAAKALARMNAMSPKMPPKMPMQMPPQMPAPSQGLKGGGIAVKGKGMALRGGGIAVKGKGIALKKGGMGRKGK